MNEDRKFVRDVFSKREMTLPDVYRYDALTDKLKNQIYHIWRNFYRQRSIPENFRNQIWERIGEVISEEHGKKEIWTEPFGMKYLPHYKVEKYFEELDDIKLEIDVIEISFRFLDNTFSHLKALKIPIGRIGFPPQLAIKELNQRFFENGYGFEYNQRRIIRKDSELLHANLVQPALYLLTPEEFTNAKEELVSAFDHYNNERYKECLNECLKAFESTMKIICDLKGWNYDPQKDTASKLINICLGNNLFPGYLQNHFTGIRTSLESGVPTIRNKNSGHGQGTEKKIVPKQLVDYMLYLTANSIKFLIESYEKIK